MSPRRVTTSERELITLDNPMNIVRIEPPASIGKAIMRGSKSKYLSIL
jgi:hypothetical protein